MHDRDPAITETLEALTPLIKGEFQKVFANQICEIGTKFVENELSALLDDYTSKLSFGDKLKLANSSSLEFISFMFPWENLNEFVIDSNLIGLPIGNVSFCYLNVFYEL